MKSPLSRTSLSLRRGWLPAAVAVFAVGCQTLRFNEQSQPADAAEPKLPSRHQQRVSQYVFTSDFQVPADAPLLKELTELRDQVAKELRLPPAHVPIKVYLFEDQQKYRAYMRKKHPELPERRAYFLAWERSPPAADDLIVYTSWGDNIRQDLRHELTHALMHRPRSSTCRCGSTKVWPSCTNCRPSSGLNPAHLEELRKPEFRANLSRLEGLTLVRDMKRAEYQEAWAWVHFMLRGKPENRAILLQYLQDLRSQGEAAPPLLPRLREAFAVPSNALENHLARLEAARRR